MTKREWTPEQWDVILARWGVVPIYVDNDGTRHYDKKAIEDALSYLDQLDYRPESKSKQ